MCPSNSRRAAAAFCEPPAATGGSTRIARAGKRLMNSATPGRTPSFPRPSSSIWNASSDGTRPSSSTAGLPNREPGYLIKRVRSGATSRPDPVGHGGQDLFDSRHTGDHGQLAERRDLLGSAERAEQHGPEVGAPAFEGRQIGAALVHPGGLGRHEVGHHDPPFRAPAMPGQGRHRRPVLRLVGEGQQRPEPLGGAGPVRGEDGPPARMPCPSLEADGAGLPSVGAGLRSDLDVAPLHEDLRRERQPVLEGQPVRHYPKALDCDERGGPQQSRLACELRPRRLDEPRFAARIVQRRGAPIRVPFGQRPQLPSCGLEVALHPPLHRVPAPGEHGPLAGYFERALVDVQHGVSPLQPPIGHVRGAHMRVRGRPSPVLRVKGHAGESSRERLGPTT